MRNAMLLMLLMSGYYCARSQSETIVDHTTYLIAGGKYNNAEKYLDSILAGDPQNIDAKMMLGNVYLNYSLMQTPAIHIITPQDETIFSADVATVKDNIVIVPRATAEKVDKLWRACLAIDPARLDIQKGLCSLYGMALMKEELLAYLPVIAGAGRSKGNDFAYTLVEYARLIHERGDRAGAYEVYKKIESLYPSVSGIRCIIAAQYFTDGDLAHAKAYTEKGMSGAMPDLISCRDALDIYTAIADPAQVLTLLKAASKDPSYKDYPFYLAIYQYVHRDTAWRRSIDTYLARHPDSSAVYEAAKYMTSKDFTKGYMGLMGLLNYNLNDYSTKLLADRAIQDYRDSAVPYVIAVQVQMNDKNYIRANELMAAMTQKNPGAKDLLYYYAYSLYCAGDYRASIDRWSQYTAAAMRIDSSRRDSYLAAPYYFIGQCYLRSGDQAKGTEYLHMILAGKDDSKYAYLAKVQMDNLALDDRSR